MTLVHRSLDRLGIASVLTLLVLLTATAAGAQCVRPNDCLPPQGGCAYVAPNTVCYLGTSICVRDLELENPTACTSASAGTFDSFFDIEYRIQRSTDGGTTWTPYNGVAHGGMHFQTTTPPPPTQILQTEMVALELTGVPGTMIRESPSKASDGQHAVTDQGNGTFRIDSFFDVFTELSLDGGQTWMQADSPLHSSLGGGPTPVLPVSWGRIKALYN